MQRPKFSFSRPPIHHSSWILITGKQALSSTFRSKDFSLAARPLESELMLNNPHFPSFGNGFFNELLQEFFKNVSSNTNKKITQERNISDTLQLTSQEEITHFFLAFMVMQEYKFPEWTLHFEKRNNLIKSPVARLIGLNRFKHIAQHLSLNLQDFKEFLADRKSVV